MKRNWQIIEAPFQPGKLNHLETLFTIGNGFLGIRGSFEEGYPGEEPLLLAHGIFNHPPELTVSELAPLPAWPALAVTINGQPFGLDQGQIHGYERTLDLQTGLLTRAILWEAPDGTICRLRFERFASLTRPHVLALRLEIVPLNRAAEIEICGGTGALDVNHWTDVESGHETPGRLTLTARTTQSSYRLGMALDLDVSPQAAFAADRVSNTPCSTVQQHVDAGSTMALTELVAIHTSRDADDPLGAARHTLEAARSTGYDLLLAESTAAWEEIWFTSDVQIEGDDFAQLAIRAALYHLNIAAPRHDDRVSIGAKTLSGRGYKGHIFWDTELFALTPFTYTQPQVACSLLRYRYHLLPGARHKAAAEGYEGAMYPWESTDTGEETTPKWSDPHPANGERERIWTGDREIHISADIAYALHNYWRISGDDDFMLNCGAEILLDTAVFWASRAELNAQQGRYEFTQVIGPDEYHENVDNSVFTNVMVRWHLRTALEVLAWLRETHPVQADALELQLKLTDERLAHWQDIIDRLYIPRDGDIYVQFDGFFDLEPIEVKAYQPRTSSLQSVFGTRAVNASQIIKQADVIMLIALLGDSLGTPEVLRVNWDVYEPRCDHGSSLSAAMHSLVAARLGLVDTAYAYWTSAAAVDLEDNKGNTAHGIHAASSGGIWQALVFGFAGLVLQDGELTVDPRLPAHWRSMMFKVVHRGVLHEIRITPDGTRIQPVLGWQPSASLQS